MVYEREVPTPSPTPVPSPIVVEAEEAEEAELPIAAVSQPYIRRAVFSICVIQNQFRSWMIIYVANLLAPKIF